MGVAEARWTCSTTRLWRGSMSLKAGQSGALCMPLRAEGLRCMRVWAPPVSCRSRA